MNSRSPEVERRFQRKGAIINGSQIEYHHIGKGPPVIFIHGWNGSSMVYKKVIEHLSSDYTCIVPELPGFGISPPFEKQPHILTSYASVISELAKELNYPEYGVIGHSMGSLIALELAKQDSAVQYLILEGVPNLSKRLRRTIQSLPEPLTQRFFKAIYGNPQLSFLLEFLNPEFLKHLSNQQRRERSRRLGNAYFPAIAQSFRAIAEFAHIPPSVPTLVLEGSKPTPIGRLVSAQRYPWGSQVSVQQIGGASHSVGVQNPKDSINAMKGFIQSRI